VGKNIFMGNQPKKFYDQTVSERLETLSQSTGLTGQQLAALDGENGLTIEQANAMIENGIGIYSLPIGIAQNFLINGKNVLIPMVIEEPSVIAAASFMAKLVRAGGGFKASITDPVMIGQMQLLDLKDISAAHQIIEQHCDELLAHAALLDPVLVKVGGGPRDLKIRTITDSPIGSYLVLHWLVDVRDAMGANAVNTIVEGMSAEIERLTGGRVHLRILTNLADERLAKATCTIPLAELAFGDYTGEQVRDGILEAWSFAASDPYRAATHNKGIMNGVDAVVLATANDWRAVEAGAHAYAARSGRYTSLSTWAKDAAGNLTGELEMPMAVGTVGGATRVHPGAQAALKLMGVSTSRDLAEIIVSVGLAQNLAALRALSTEGIQRGHMTLHARQVALSAGATGDQIEKLAGQLVREKTIRVERAVEILKEWGK
jgi:hydroxymethylglutaryl-CoA reductase